MRMNNLRWMKRLLALAASGMILLAAGLPVSAGKKAPKMPAKAQIGELNTAPSIPLPGDNAEAAAAPTADTAATGDVYDIILFFGQSNLVGESYPTDLQFDNGSAEAVAEAAAQTGIDADIVQNAVDNTRTFVEQIPDTVYEYSLLDNEFYPIEEGMRTGKDRKLAGAVAWDPASSSWVSTSVVEPSLPNAFARSNMVNMVPEFCSSYHRLTGHKVIAVLCALGGVPIQAYLPMDDPGYLAPLQEGSDYAYMYKGVVDSFNGALNRAAQNGWNVAGRYFVSFQGESDIYNPSYNDYYMQVVRQWQQLGITKGALVETSFTIGEPLGAQAVQEMHLRQEKLIVDNPCLVLGSSFDFDHYVPDKSNYNAFWKGKWNDADWEDAYGLARLVTDAAEQNRIHLNSAALTQIGRETAENLAAFVMADVR